jgi:hypothetical protein
MVVHNELAFITAIKFFFIRKSNFDGYLLCCMNKNVCPGQLNATL